MARNTPDVEPSSLHGSPANAERSGSTQALTAKAWRRATSRYAFLEPFTFFRSQPWKDVERALRTYESHAWVPDVQANNPFLPTRKELGAERAARAYLIDTLDNYRRHFESRGAIVPHAAVLDGLTDAVRLKTQTKRIAQSLKEQQAQWLEREYARSRAPQPPTQATSLSRIFDPSMRSELSTIPSLPSTPLPQTPQQPQSQVQTSSPAPAAHPVIQASASSADSEWLTQAYASALAEYAAALEPVTPRRPQSRTPSPTPSRLSNIPEIPSEEGTISQHSAGDISSPAHSVRSTTDPRPQSRGGPRDTTIPTSTHPNRGSLKLR